MDLELFYDVLFDAINEKADRYIHHIIKNPKEHIIWVITKDGVFSEFSVKSCLFICSAHPARDHYNTGNIL